MTAAAGIARNQAVTILLATFKRTSEMSRRKEHDRAPVSAQQPCIGLRRVILEPIV